MNVKIHSPSISMDLIDLRVVVCASSVPQQKITVPTLHCPLHSHQPRIRILCSADAVAASEIRTVNFALTHESVTQARNCVVRILIHGARNAPRGNLDSMRIPPTTKGSHPQQWRQVSTSSRFLPSRRKASPQFVLASSPAVTAPISLSPVAITPFP
jgi:hypothetical protein